MLLDATSFALLAMDGLPAVAAAKLLLDSG
jgi:hypothetical protein